MATTTNQAETTADVLVIGFGKAGKTIAMNRAEHGDRVILVEQSPKMYGGTCINIACVPTKTMLVDSERGVNYEGSVQHRDSFIATLNKVNKQLADDSVASAELEGDALRYGENPHQQASIVREGTTGVANAKQLHGKEMSYNNYQDADAAWRAAWDHERPCVAIIKHANPCGIAVSDESIAAAHAAAHACDPMSAFGGVIAVNREVTKEMATQVADIFTEVIIAPSYEDGAVEILQGKKNIRILVAEHEVPAVEVKEISGGRLLQEADVYQAEGDKASTWTLAAGEAASEEKLAELEFAWRAVRSVKSNAILLAHEGATVGVGMGQVNRVDSAKLAVDRANTLADSAERARGSVAASDAFFPFADGLQVLIDAGVSAVVQPGGSIRDEEVIAAAEAAGITMYFTGTRHFAH